MFLLLVLALALVRASDEDALEVDEAEEDLLRKHGVRVQQKHATSSGRKVVRMSAPRADVEFEGFDEEVEPFMERLHDMLERKDCALVSCHANPENQTLACEFTCERREMLPKLRRRLLRHLSHPYQEAADEGEAAAGTMGHRTQQHRRAAIRARTKASATKHRPIATGQKQHRQ